ncbi:MAG TPA: DHCW motif cupin fold protein [Devosiaceae bacterium]|jgi:quercetin dioxygenase-like cupin family protein|nr:DHCW motif cupin fold protein [Devosiaceae bacterium]
MRMSDIPFGTTDWARLPPERHAGDVGEATWRTCRFGSADNPIRVRMVEYSPGYQADHWCDKGHVLLCLEGALTTTLEDGREFELAPGMSYQVGDQAEKHRSRTAVGARLFIVD